MVNRSVLLAIWLFLHALLPGSLWAGELKLGFPFPVDTREWDLSVAVAEEIHFESDEYLQVFFSSLVKKGPGLASQIAGGSLDGGLVSIQDFAKLNLGRNAYAYGAPFLFTSVEELMAVRARLDQEILLQISKGPYQALAILDMGFSYALSTKALCDPKKWDTHIFWQPLQKKTVIDLEVIPDVLGWRTVALPAKAVKQGFRQGIVDSVIAPPAIAVLKRWHTDIKCALKLPYNFNYGIWILRDDALSRLTSKEMQVFQAQLRILTKELSLSIRKRNNRAWKVLDRNEIKIILPDSNTENQWRIWSSSVWKDLDDRFRPEITVEQQLKQLLENLQ